MSLEVSGRERFLVMKAFAYAIAVIDALPSQLQAISDRDQMKVILDREIENDDELARTIGLAQQHVRAISK
ncbi:hypothetical protein [Mesorhizobium marinum]|uniref:hypothetical protein n=1 Tax=Mesorhizobium marinum TaxID=3228790 RepID=UPI0034665267